MAGLLPGRRLGVNRDLQFYGLIALTLIAIVVLILIGWVLYLVGSHIRPDGTVPSAEAFGLGMLILGFREVIGALKAIWAYENQAAMTGHLAESSPGTRPSGTPGDPVHVEEAEDQGGKKR